MLGLKPALFQCLPQLRTPLRCCREPQPLRSPRLWAASPYWLAQLAGVVFRPGVSPSPLEQQVRPAYSPLGDPESLVAGTGVTLEYAWVGLAGAAALCREKGLRL